jgi:hypothetical protein
VTLSEKRAQQWAMAATQAPFKEVLGATEGLLLL